MEYEVKSPKKLIEVALPLDKINAAASKEKSIRHGHPSTLHLWWARRPLAAARAVIFAQMVNDPSWQWCMEHGNAIPPNHLKGSWANSRKRLFKIIEDMVLWENIGNVSVMEKARKEIRRSWEETCRLNSNHPNASELFNPSNVPAFHDPFAGGGALPLEAQRLGLEAYASDLNPVAVLINKAMIEIPPKFSCSEPLGPIEPAGSDGSNYHHAQVSQGNEWRGAQGLAEDVRRYGVWLKNEAEKTIGHLYPKMLITHEIAGDRPDLATFIGEEMTVIAWLWARTVKSPNPVYSQVDVPLVSSFILSSKKGNEVWIDPVIQGNEYKFIVHMGTPNKEANEGTSAGKRNAFSCIMSKTPIDYNYIRKEGQAGRIGARLLAVVVEGKRERIYLSPMKGMEDIAFSAKPNWKSDLKLPENTRDFKTPNYGMDSYGDLFTSRQLVALNTFAGLISVVREKVYLDSINAGMSNNGLGLDSGGIGAKAYSEAVCVYLSIAVSRISSYWSSITSHDTSREKITSVFARQAIPMLWDYMEGNPFSNTSGNFLTSVDAVKKSIAIMPAQQGSFAIQADAALQNISLNKVVSTDPPYYDNIGYADLSDFFYIWLRKMLKDTFVSLFTTISVPKTEELIAAPYRHGSKELANTFFMLGMTRAMNRIQINARSDFPVTIYYAFKQTEGDSNNATSSSGWEAFLSAVISAGFLLCGTWPIRTEMSGRALERSGINALASSIVLVCRKRLINAAIISRREFQRELNQVLPEALDEMTKGAGDDHSPVAPVDLSQAIIGPGMAIFSKYAAVLEADGTPMTVRTALQLINRFLAEDDFDAETQFCLQWYEQYGWKDDAYGIADVLARAKSTSVDGLVDAGVVESGSGSVRLKKWTEYPTIWNPSNGIRLPVWETLHQLVRILRQQGEEAAGLVLGSVKQQTESVRQLAYRLYTLSERSGRAEDARAYNELITSWSGIEKVSETVLVHEVGERQMSLFDSN